MQTSKKLLNEWNDHWRQCEQKSLAQCAIETTMADDEINGAIHALVSVKSASNVDLRLYLLSAILYAATLPCNASSSLKDLITAAIEKDTENAVFGERTDRLVQIAKAMEKLVSHGCSVGAVRQFGQRNLISLGYRLKDKAGVDDALLAALIWPVLFDDKSEEFIARKLQIFDGALRQAMDNEQLRRAEEEEKKEGTPTPPVTPTPEPTPDPVDPDPEPEPAPIPDSDNVPLVPGVPLPPPSTNDSDNSESESESSSSSSSMSLAALSREAKKYKQEFDKLMAQRAKTEDGLHQVADILVHVLGLNNEKVAKAERVEKLEEALELIGEIQGNLYLNRED
jgi:hypothetical protein